MCNSKDISPFLQQIEKEIFHKVHHFNCADIGTWQGQKFYRIDDPLHLLEIGLM
jgi:hypothetical protein